MNDLVIKDDSYNGLVEQITATITESVFTSRWALIEGYWLVGKLIREEIKLKKWEQNKAGVIMQNLADDTRTSERTLYRCLQCFDQYPELDQIPDGKNITWNKLITEHLIKTEREKKWSEDIQHSENMNPLTDKIWNEIFALSKIERFTKDGGTNILDDHFHIDVILYLENGMKITAQEHIRRSDYLKYDDFTLEYMSNDQGKYGEWFNICAELYLYGWGDDNGILKANVFKTVDFKRAVASGDLKGNLMSNTTHSSASFYAFPFSQFKEDWFIYRC